jgi:hypothetical protein
VPDGGRGRRATVRAVAVPVLAIFDDDGEAVELDADEATALFALTGDLDAATVSACPGCRGRILAVVALADVLAEAPPFARSGALLQLADDAPTLHVYVRDLASGCDHRAWRDPGFEEWLELVSDRSDPRATR